MREPIPAPPRPRLAILVISGCSLTSECDVIGVDSGSDCMLRLGQFALSSRRSCEDYGSGFVQSEEKDDNLVG